MKIFYNSKFAKLMTPIYRYTTITLFGMVFTEHDSLTERTIWHETQHGVQYWTDFVLGAFLALVLLIYFVANGMASWWLLSLIAIPALLFYLFYLLQYLVRVIIAWFKLFDSRKAHKKAYYSISYEAEAYDLESDCFEVEEKRRKAKPFSHWKYMFNSMF